MHCYITIFILLTTAMYYTLQHAHVLYAISAYTPCKFLTCHQYLPSELNIKHLQLHKHCPCGTVVARNPLGQRGGEGGNHLAMGRLW